MFNPNVTAKYLDNPRNCPFCDSTVMAGDIPTATDSKTMIRNIECISCHKKWQEVFKLFSIEKP